MAQDYNPAFPAEPNAMYVVKVKCEPAEAANVSGRGTYEPGKSVTINTSAKSTSYIFDYWTLNGTKYSTSKSFSYKVTEEDVEFVAHYTYKEPEPEPYNPAFPSEPTVIQPVKKIVENPLCIIAAPNGSCSFNRTSGAKVQEDQSVYVRAYPNTDFVFNGWYLNGSIVSKDLSFYYVMGSVPTTLTASFTYIPKFPSEPSEDETKQEESGEKVDNGQSGIKGDVNHDGVVNTADAVMLMNLYISGDPEKQLVPNVCDVNGDGVVNTADAVAIMDGYLKNK